MAAYKHILVAADLIAKDDDPVVSKALELAGTNAGCQISLIHVVEPVYNYGGPYVAGDVSQWQEELEKSAESSLSKLGEKLGVPVERQHLPTGQPKHHIIATANQVGADLILIGSHGRHGLNLLLMGSTANAVLHHANCDVLCVRVQEN
ncbi:MAG: universal stress protein [Chlamydiia bacterium]|nr:universal stress protein [Chlamydiia bacterium]